MNGLYKAELIKAQGPRHTVDPVDVAIMEWVDWFNHRRLCEDSGDMSPAEREALYSCHCRVLKPVGLRTRRCDSVAGCGNDRLQLR
ncbi:IS3 family transposase [Mycolicibacterium setense]